MTVTIKKPVEIGHLREGGKLLAGILRIVADRVAPGVHTKELEDFARAEMEKAGGIPAFLGYKPHGAKRPYPAALCVSINDAIVHGIPNEEDFVLKEGDIVSLDAGLKYKNLYTDTAITVPVGRVRPEEQKLIDVTKEALEAGIRAVRAGGTVGDIGFAVEEFVRPHGLGIVRELSGHGVGYKVHEDPYVPNYGEKGQGERLQAGMVIAIEPMLTLGTEKIKLDKDGYTYRTTDGSKAAHFEHTIVVTESGAEILTQL